MKRTNKNINLFLTGGLVSLILTLLFAFGLGCGEQPDLPSNVNVRVGDFGANDTSFVRVRPDWDASNGYTWNLPSDIQVGRDGLIYVVDYTADSGRVVQMTRSGSVVRNNLFESIADTTRKIFGIGQDSKLQLYMVNGTDKIYAWNQVHSLNTIKEIYQLVILEHLETGEIDTVDLLSTPVWHLDPSYLEDYYPIEIISTSHPDSIRQITEGYVFYSDTTSLSGAQFTDVSSGVDYSSNVYVTDRNSDRIIELTAMPVRIVEFSDGNLGFTFTGVYNFNQVVGFGQGQGSTNNPTSIVNESAGGSNTAVYFTQTSGNFLVQRVYGVGSNWFFDLAATPEGEPEVLHLNYFGSPHAIAVGEKDSRGLGLFYIADSTQNRVPAFHPNGFLFREVAAEERLIDLQTGQDLASIIEAGSLDFNQALNPDLSYDFIAENDTTISLYLPILNGPKGVATIEGVVFIADTGNNRILRFQRTDSDSYIPNEGD